MNNRQVAVLAASMRTGGRTMNSVQDMLEDSKVIEQDLNERDAQEAREGLHEAWARYDSSQTDLLSRGQN